MLLVQQLISSSMGEQDLDPLKEPQAMKQIHHRNQMCGGFLIGKIQRLALLDSAANPWEETHGTRLAFASSTVATLAAFHHGTIHLQ
jgi:hypothetical protein